MRVIYFLCLISIFLLVNLTIVYAEPKPINAQVEVVEPSPTPIGQNSGSVVGDGEDIPSYNPVLSNTPNEESKIKELSNQEAINQNNLNQDLSLGTFKLYNMNSFLLFILSLIVVFCLVFIILIFINKRKHDKKIKEIRAKIKNSEKTRVKTGSKKRIKRKASNK